MHYKSGLTDIQRKASNNFIKFWMIYIKYILKERVITNIQLYGKETIFPINFTNYSETQTVWNLMIARHCSHYQQVMWRLLTVLWIKINCHCQYVQPSVRTNHSTVLGQSDQWECSVTSCPAKRNVGVKSLSLLRADWASPSVSPQWCRECQRFVNDLLRLKCWNMSVSWGKTNKISSRVLLFVYSPSGMILFFTIMGFNKISII